MYIHANMNLHQLTSLEPPDRCQNALAAPQPARTVHVRVPQALATEEPIRGPGVFTITIIIFLLRCPASNKLFSLSWPVSSFYTN